MSQAELSRQAGRTASGHTIPGRDAIVISGTSYDVDELKEKFKAFILQYRPGVTEDDGDVDMDEQNPLRGKYVTILYELLSYHDGNGDLPIDMHELHAHDSSLYDAIVHFPGAVVAMFDGAIEEIATELIIPYIVGEINSEEADEEAVGQMMQEILSHCTFSIQPYNLMDADVRTLVELGPSDVDNLVQVRGMVTRTRGRESEVGIASFKCSNCSRIESREILMGKVDHPSECPNCKQLGTFDIYTPVSGFIDRQKIVIQEAPDQIPVGETPTSVNVHLSAALVNKARSGDRVNVVGIFRVSPRRSQRGRKAILSEFLTHLDLVHLSREDHLDQEAADGHSRDMPLAETEQDRAGMVRKIIDWVKEKEGRPDMVYNALIDALAPSIIGHERVKLGLLCQMVGGVSKLVNGTRLRGEMHVLLVGDPGVAKSQLLKQVHDVSARGVFTSGKGSSAVGLTAAVNKDPENGEMMLEVGALVLSDGGICCIDEFDKMSDQTRATLHEVMEQQSISIAKAGIVSALRARTAVLAAANPRTSRYDPKRSVVANISLGPTLLSRFDLIYLMLDNADAETDRNTCDNILRMQLGDMDVQKATSLPEGVTLRQYISIARIIKPQLRRDARDYIQQKYLDQRSAGFHTGAVAVLPRQLESMIRIAEALAKLRMSSEVTAADAEQAFILVQEALLKAATDPNTNRLDMNMLATGMAQSDRQRRVTVEVACRNVLKNSPVMMSHVDLVKAVLAALENNDEKIPEAQARALLQGYLSDRARLAEHIFFEVGPRGVGGLYGLKTNDYRQF
ncbi:Mini-chromosome maintenance 4 [Carpediemonas membranifera]|uniref:DNA helicase n=1 Tax=Carpediemonas membranifera TaxID=201153 RepID=A0A8J6B0Q7_9EUKA|nr:Mini-chromosome maintenance 4 [Carpediemonas membranifera]|eukprot:KAG9393078.1 Mini-chromosome maintenance 4 [Carpediemonas membranifera]